MAVTKLQILPPRAGPFMGPDGIVSQNWYGFFRAIFNTVNGNLTAGFSGTIPLAKLTAGGTNGSITVTNGIITAVVNPT